MYGGGGISSPAISTSKSVLFNRCWLVASWCCSKPNKEVFFLQIISYCSTQEVPLNGPRGLCLYSIRSTFFLGDENHLIRQKAAPIPPLPHTFNLALFHSFSTFQFFFQFTCPLQKGKKNRVIASYLTRVNIMIRQLFCSVTSRGQDKTL